MMHTAAPVAVVDGVPLVQLPQDLYIPPDALEVFLETFEGPLDLLLYLIKRQNLDILDIPIASVTAQYMTYIELMKDIKLELAAEYLVMAAMLAEIKSRMLLPRHAFGSEEEEDPRAELVRRLQEYERYKKAAEDLDTLPRMERDTFAVFAEFVEKRVTRPPPVVAIDALSQAMTEIWARARMFTHHHVQREPLSVRERMAEILGQVTAERFTQFTKFFQVEEGRMGVVVAFLAILELLKGSLIEIVQNEPGGPIYVKAAT
jgi:segregation and condensation protein A